MFKLLLTIAAIYILFKLITNDKKKKQQTFQNKENTKVPSGEMVKDPICGTFVPKNSDIRVRIGEKVECFCSYECRDKFLKQLEK
ncbi:hypothetical protein SAMN04488516_101251 [Desulfonauticus submarinus]|uniref:TRASH domain-containing protein n=1 Tax=Desulfonauticus submarinus TaxID=206665 RepID=A0A1H0A431_9BACT|nr:transcriptional regulator [Desulfonauticus submarinus]SDN27456.1 hypothetical protein SAMN04488516_101251 [Desulfonauticus submarinus]